MNPWLERAIETQAIVVTATNRLARELQQQAASAQSSHPQGVWPTLTVLSWSQWLQQLWRYCPPQKPLLLSSAQSLSLWESVIRDDIDQYDQHRAPLWQLSATAKAAQDAWNLCQQWQIDPQTGATSSAEDHRCFSRWAKAYQNTLTEKNWCDQSSMPAYLSQHTAKAASGVYILGFDHVTQAQKTLRDALAQNQDVRFILNTSEASIPSAQAHHFSTTEAEWRAIAQWAQRCISTAEKPVKLGIITPDSASIATTASRILSESFLDLRQFNHHETADWFHFSNNGSLAQQPQISLALALLNTWNSQGYTHFSQILCSPIIGDSNEYLMRCRFEADVLKRQGKAKLNIIDLKNSIEASNIPLDSLSSCLQQLIQLKKKYSGKRSYLHWVHCFSAWLKNWNWLHTKSLSTQEFQLEQAWLQSLTLLAEFDLIEPAVSHGRALSRLMALLEQTGFQPEAKADAPIQIMGMLEATGQQFDAVWVCGLTENAWPAQVKLNPLLPGDALRQTHLTQAHPDSHWLHAEQVLSQIVSSSQRSTVLSYARSNQGSAQVPSRFIAMAAAPVFGTDHHHTNTITQPSLATLETIADNQGAALNEAQSTGGTSLIRDQAQCPFKAYLGHRLGLKQTAEPELGIDVLNQGSLVHAVLAAAWELHPRKLDWPEAHETTAISAQLVPIIDTIYPKYHAKSGLGEGFALCKKESLLSLACEWMSYDLNRPAFTVTDCELDASYQIKELTLNFVIDRVDQLGDGSIAVIDYKTGSKDSINQWLPPLIDGPQLPLYALALQTQGKTPESMAFAQVKPRSCAYKGVTLDTDSQPLLSHFDKALADTFSDWPTLLAAWQSQFEQTATDFMAGAADITPSISACQYCDYATVCRKSSLTNTPT